MKTLTLVLLAFSVSSLAAEAVKITSFRRTDFNNIRNDSAEVCGKVLVPLKGTERILLTSDYNSNRPGEYVTLPSPKGNFCHVISTTYGSVKAELVGGDVPFSVTQDL